MNAAQQIYSVPVLLPSGESLAGELRIWEQAPESPDAVLLELWFDERRLRATAEEGFFEALSSIRKELESEGIRLGCYGCSRNVFPSPMIRSMGYGEKAYRLKMGRPARLEDLVSIFDSGQDVDPATLAEQEKYYRDWINSLG